MSRIATKHRIYPMGDHSAVVEFALDDNLRGEIDVNATMLETILSLLGLIEQAPLPGLIEAVPGMASVTVHYDPLRVWMEGEGMEASLPYEKVCDWLRVLTERLDMKVSKLPPNRIVEIPVCYGGEYGFDLETVAKAVGVTNDDLIRLHSSTEYVVQMIGFAPGFPYLSGLPSAIAAPRRAVPRLQVAAGSVGIGGGQTGIYPLASPGGWHIIGRTPIHLFRPNEVPPSLLQAGDQVRFYPITPQQYGHAEVKIRWASQ